MRARQVFGRGVVAAVLAAAVACNMGPTDSAPTPPASTAVAPPPPPSAPLPAAPPPAAPVAAPASLAVSQLVTANAVTLVRAESALSPLADSLPIVTLSKSDLLVGTSPIGKVFPGPLGFDGAIKRQGQRAALEVVPLKAALRAVHDMSPTESSLRLLVDASTSYRSALEAEFSAAQAGFTSFGFVVSSAKGERRLAVVTPTRAERDAEHKTETSPPISFVLRADGVVVSVGAVSVGAGCTKGASGTTIPLRAGKPDLAALASCVSRLKSMDPAWAHSTIGEVSASPELDMQTVLEAVSVIVRELPAIHFGMLSA